MADDHGYYGYGGIAPRFGEQTYDPNEFGGQGGVWQNDGHGNPIRVPRTRGSDLEAQRYSDLASGYNGVAAPTIDRTQSDESRGYQLGALGMLDQRARGIGPSVAGTEAIRAAQSIAAGARGGPGAELAAQRMAGQQAGSTYGDARAKEMAAYTGQYFGAASGMRGQDIGLATSQAQQEAQQRALNAQGQQYFEGKRYDVNKSQLDANQRAQQESDQAWNEGQRTKQGNDAQDLSHQVGSDERMKEDVTPLFGSIAAPGAPSASGGLVRDNPYGNDADIVRTNPYGSPAATTTPAAKEPSSKLAGVGDYLGGSGGLIGKAGKIISLAALLSDERTKDGVEPLFGKPKDAGPDVVPLYEPPGKQLHQSAEGRAFYVDEPTFGGDDRPSLAGSSSKKSAPKQAKAPAAAPPKRDPVRDMTPDEMMAAADKMLAKIKADTDAIPRTQSAVQPALDRSSAPSYGALMMSDDRTKLAAAFEAGRALGPGTAKPLYGGGEAAEAKQREASYDNRSPTDAAEARKRREYAETRRDFDAGIDAVRASGLRVPHSPAVGGSGVHTLTLSSPEERTFGAGESPMANANRSMAPSAYSYKPGFTPPDQAPGERNVGPMAQNMAADPVASTAIKTFPGSDLLGIDQEKALKLTMGGVASLQEQQDENTAKLIELERQRIRRGRR